MQIHPGLIEPVRGRGGTSGWSLVRLDGCDEALAGRLLKLAWAGVAPKKLLDAGRG
jgi:hypothetical protein